MIYTIKRLGADQMSKRFWQFSRFWIDLVSHIWFFVTSCIVMNLWLLKAKIENAKQLTRKLEIQCYFK